MPRFGKRSLTHLKTTHVKLQILFHIVIRYFDCSILHGYRSPEKQLQLFKSGLSKVKVSKHGSIPSNAIDVAPYPVEWKNLKRFYYFAGFVMGIAAVMKIKIRWGGDWNMNTRVEDESFRDLNHFELLEGD